MKKTIFLNLLVNLSLIFLSACQTPPKPQPTAEESDPDIIVMHGFGTNHQSSSSLGVKPLTFSELSDCAKKIGQLDEESMRLKIENAKFDKRKGELERKSNDIDAERPLVDVRNSKKVSDFNKRLEDIRAAFGEFDKEINTYNNDIAAQTTRNNEFNVSCANRSLRQSDIAKLPLELRDAITLHTEDSDVPIKEDAHLDGSSTNGVIHLPASSRH